jgi:hypothetical protein
MNIRKYLPWNQAPKFMELVHEKQMTFTSLVEIPKGASRKEIQRLADREYERVWTHGELTADEEAKLETSSLLSTRLRIIDRSRQRCLIDTNRIKAGYK